MKQTLTAEQLEAIQQFAKQYGRTWKSALREAWMTGDYGTFETSNLLQQIRNTFGPSWLVSFHLPNEIPGKVTLSPKSARAAQKYGLDACIKAYARNQEGYGASTIAFENGWRTNQADAAINAGEEYTVFTTGHGLPYGAPVACCIADGCGRKFNSNEPEQRNPLTLKPFWKRYCPEHRMNPAGLQVPIVNIPPVSGSHYDYENQAWTLDGKYIACEHPESMHCDCYGTRHAGEIAPIENLPTATESN